jgi:hypothetical protein
MKVFKIEVSRSVRQTTYISVEAESEESLENFFYMSEATKDLDEIVSHMDRLSWMEDFIPDDGPEIDYTILNEIQEWDPNDTPDITYEQLKLLSSMEAK